VLYHFPRLPFPGLPSNCHQRSQIHTKKRKRSKNTREVIELILLEIVRIRFVALGVVRITNRLLSLCVRPRRECQTPILPVYPACTSVQRFGGFSQFCCFVVSITCASSTSLIVRSPPPLPFISLMDGHLTKTRGGKKGQIRPMVRFRFSFQRHG
jgi:hypothetical protein